MPHSPIYEEEEKKTSEMNSSVVQDKKSAIQENFFYPSSIKNDNMIEDERPIKFDFLNVKEQKAIDNLSLSRSRSSNTSVSRSMLQEMRTAPSISNLQSYKLEQKGTTISIYGVENKSQMEMLLELLKANEIPYERCIPILDNQEIMIRLLSFDQCTAIANFL